MSFNIEEKKMENGEMDKRQSIVSSILGIE